MSGPLAVAPQDWASVIDWKDPLYAPVFEERSRRLLRLRENPQLISGLRDYYREHPADFINDFGVTFDPRNADVDKLTIVPFILTPKQREWITWVLARWHTRTRGINEKSRDMGVTWLAVSLACTLCLFREGIVVGFGSRKAEYVDEIGTMKPILPKGRMFMEHLPSEFRGTWEAWRDAPLMRINFPETGSIITGEAGDSIGRGDRAQPLYSKILTPEGWKLMGDLLVGQRVIGSSGAPIRVTGVYPQGRKLVYRVTFSDGAYTECCGEHLWRVTTSANRKTKRAVKARAAAFQTLELSKIKADLAAYRPSGLRENRYQIPVLSSPVQFDQTSTLPLDPYFLGALIGDGSLSQPRITPGFATADAEMIGLLQAVAPPEIRIVSAGGYNYRISDNRGHLGRGYRSPVKGALDALGLTGKKSHTKFIPGSYKQGTPEQRLHLLQGLLDTDGWIRSRKSAKAAPQICFCTTSRQLADDLKEVVQSLGGLAFDSQRIASGRRKFPGGRWRDTREAYVLTLKMPAGMNPFRLSRKASKYKDRQHYKRATRSIVKVEEVGWTETQCIRVDAPDHLYVTDNCIITHNTTLYFVDEAMHHPKARLIEASLSNTTRCRIDMSSVNGMNNPIAQKRWEWNDERVFIFDWHDDPRKDDEWYKAQIRDYDPVVVAQEVDRDYSASVTGIVIPGAWVRSCLGACEKLGIEPTGPYRGVLDVADAGVDKNSFGHFHGVQVEYLELWSGKGSDLAYTAQHAVDVCDLLGLSGFRYDADGMGASIRGDVRIINEKRISLGAKAKVIEGWRGSEAVANPEAIVEGIKTIDGQDRGRKNKDYYFNRKAQGWGGLRRRIEKTHNWITKNIPAHPDEIFSISPKCPLAQHLIAELSQPTWEENGVGKMVVDKTPNGMPSPNLADLVMMNYAPGEQARVVASADVMGRLRAMGPRRRFT